MYSCATMRVMRSTLFSSAGPVRLDESLEVDADVVWNPPEAVGRGAVAGGNGCVEGLEVEVDGELGPARCSCRKSGLQHAEPVPCLRGTAECARARPPRRPPGRWRPRSPRSTMASPCHRRERRARARASGRSFDTRRGRAQGGAGSEQRSLSCGGWNAFVRVRVGDVLVGRFSKRPDGGLQV